MQLDVDVAGRRVVVLGDRRDARRVVRRYTAAGAQVTSARPDSSSLDRLVQSAWLVVTVGLPRAQSARVRRLTTAVGVLTVEEPAASARGIVTLVGGGPGFTELLTLAACTALREADVVYYDRLAPTDDLARLAPGAELVDVGKTPYHHQISQDRISELLILRAQRGDGVVRLKGGDPFVFGRGGEELHACAAAGVDVRVVPGVSSAVAVPAAAGIPVTHRGISRTFTVISGHVLPTSAEFRALAGLGGTIVILMGVANAAAIAVGLRSAGLPDTTPAAVVERGFSASQRTTHTTLAWLGDDVRRLDVVAPAVLVVGEVTRLGRDLGLSDVGLHHLLSAA